ncbi:tripartite tricarboxylate transporter substrate binding protein [uncultured Ramlibacter sp.]|uniref:tripartite tricarboxylate transporter substrate binding protein n=1 Tax=uncultured Ramlibacter sp. TaxID=260755 RepID=UPI00261651C6|nr:tripartite tricarboxylate transporter substrate binding protein [uncultured Ramlibacter sp.]
MAFQPLRGLGLALALSLAAGTALAQQRVIRIVVPYGPGAVQDTIARTFNNELGVLLGASVIIENRAGAGGTIGTAQVAKAAPDGNTLVLAAASHTLAGHMYSKLPYDPIKDFVGVSYLGNSGYVIAAPGNLEGVNSLADYLKLLKAKPGQFNYASAGNGSATHLGMASFLAKAGAQMQHIPMKSTGDAVNEALAGRVQGVVPAVIGVVAFKQDARLKLLAYTGTSRSRFLPELPTVAEAGLPGYKFDSWFGLLAPAAMPKAEVDKLNAAVQKVMADPAVQQRFANLGVEMGAMAPDDFNKLLRADWETSGAIVKASGAKID